MRKRFALPAFFLILACACPTRAGEVEVTVEQVLTRSAEDLKLGRPSEAIRTLEAVADRGVYHPDLSYNRALGYLDRAKTPASQPGDLGQAAAGFAEVLEFRPDDAEAERGLLQAQLLVAKDQSRADTSSESHSLGLVERVLLRTRPLALLVIAGIGAVCACAGLLLRLAARENTRSAGAIFALVGVSLLLPAAGLHFSRHALFSGARVAVVVAKKAQIVDAGGGRLKGRLPLRETTLVYVGPSTSSIAPLVNLGERGYVSSAELRFLHSKTR
jgi:hypothetical protein